VSAERQPPPKKSLSDAKRNAIQVLTAAERPEELEDVIREMELRKLLLLELDVAKTATAPALPPGLQKTPGADPAKELAPTPAAASSSLPAKKAAQLSIIKSALSQLPPPKNPVPLTTALATSQPEPSKPSETSAPAGAAAASAAVPAAGSATHAHPPSQGGRPAPPAHPAAPAPTPSPLRSASIPLILLGSYPLQQPPPPSPAWPPPPPPPPDKPLETAAKPSPRHEIKTITVRKGDATMQLQMEIHNPNPRTSPRFLSNSS
jgi:hypothetical protein